MPLSDTFDLVRKLKVLLWVSLLVLLVSLQPTKSPGVRSASRRAVKLYDWSKSFSCQAFISDCAGPRVYLPEPPPALPVVDGEKLKQYMCP